MRTRVCLQSVLVVVIAACQPAVSETASPVAASRDTTTDPVEIGWQIHQLELSAAAQLYGDSTGQSEGAEELRHQLFESSIRVLRAATERDSSSARGWYFLGRALAARAYRGEGEWSVDDQSEAVAALERAARLSPSSTRQSADSALADNREILRRMQNP